MYLRIFSLSLAIFVKIICPIMAKKNITEDEYKEFMKCFEESEKRNDRDNKLYDQRRKIIFKTCMENAETQRSIYD